MMSPGVISHAQQFKVFQSIVGFVAVSVMDVLVGSQPSSKTLFHDVTMLKEVFITDSNGNVPI